MVLYRLAAGAGTLPGTGPLRGHHGQRTVAGMPRADRISAGEQAPAAEVMQPGPTTVRAHEDLDATRQRMRERHVAHLLVATPDGTLIGAVAAADS